MSANSAPPWVSLAMEPLHGMLAHLRGKAFAPQLASTVPQGQGSPVLVIPGLGAASFSTLTLRRFLSDAGYAAYDWDLGINVGPRDGLDALLTALRSRLRAIERRHPMQKVHLVGWSLGGLYARELSKSCPRLVGRVVTVGTPINGDPNATNGRLLYRILCGRSADEDMDVLRRIRIEPASPCTSVYSRLDGVVSWQACRPWAGSRTRAIEVPGVSHLGLVSDPRALSAIARALADQQA